MSTTQTSPRPTAREKLLAAADELFYGQGVNTVGIDRVIEHAGVSKASLYTAFGSKDELIRAYLTARHEARRERIERALATRFHTPREQLLGLFDVLGESIALPTFRGCAFVNASAETAPGSTARQVAETSRDWLHGLIEQLAREADARAPEQLARQLVLLYDGAMVAAQMDGDPAAASEARVVAESLLDAATVTSR